jgi:molybdate transport repressor ModE-like protein
MGLSYSKGRRILKDAESALGYKLVKRQQGGAMGGSAMITSQAELLVERYESLVDSINDFAKKRMGKEFLNV